METTARSSARPDLTPQGFQLVPSHRRTAGHSPRGNPTTVWKQKALIPLICQRCRRTARGRRLSKGKQPWAQILASALIGQMSSVVSLSSFSQR